MRRIKLAGLLVIGVLSFGLSVVPAVEATILPLTGGVGAPDPLAPSGTVLGTKSGTVTSTNNQVIATYLTQVISDPANVFCSGCLDFVYTVANSSSSHDPIGRITASSIAPGPSGSFVGFTPHSMLGRARETSSTGMQWECSARSSSRRSVRCITSVC